MRYLCRLPGKPSNYDDRYDGTCNSRRDNPNGFWSSVYGKNHGIIVAPRYFAHAITLGDATQLARAFELVSTSLQWFITHYETVQLFRVVVRRLYGLERASEIRQPHAGGIDYEVTAQDRLTVVDLALRTPQNEPLNQALALTVRPGERWLIKGGSGVGKSTLMRAVAGIWPYGSGEIRVPAQARVLFLSQKNYLPAGSLKAALCYPSEESAFSDALCSEALQDVQMPAYVARLEEIDRWGQRLSPGEQQRIALARALLQRPDFLFLDESTSALDPATEHAVYALVLRRLSSAAIVHISHRPSLDDFHDNVLHVTPAAAAAGVAALPGIHNARYELPSDCPRRSVSLARRSERPARARVGGERECAHLCKLGGAR